MVIGYGNPGRQDDGLGPAFINELETLDLPGLTLQSNYQLSVEDAFDIQNFDYVIFVDACISGDEPFTFEPLAAPEHALMGSHSLSPGAVLQLCQTLYAKSPEAYVLAIRGVEFDQFDEQLSSSAAANLKAALTYFQAWLATMRLDKSNELIHHA